MSAQPGSRLQNTDKTEHPDSVQHQETLTSHDFIKSNFCFSFHCHNLFYIWPSFAILFAITGTFGPSLAYFHCQVFSYKAEPDPNNGEWRADCSRLLEFR